MRAAITILYEGLHHLKHNGFADFMAENFDAWIVVEGHSLPYGSTKWCNMISVPATSKDGTVEFMREFASDHKNVYFYSSGGKYYNGKDQQVNVAIGILKKLTKSCYLWQVDADEQWSVEDIEKAEMIASESSEIGFKFQFNHYVGEGIIAVGEWGSNWHHRLWKWSGQLFQTHEPPILRGQKKTAPIERIKYEHYAYYNPIDVKFKSKYYPGHEKVFENWPSIQKPNTYPMPLSRLFGEDSKYSKTNSQIILI